MTDFAKVKLGLEERLRELIARTKDIDEDLSQLGDHDSDEDSIELEDDDVLKKVGDVTTKEIQQIRFAISQINAGTYGVCTNCGSPIAKERLEALPFATKCVKCS